MGRNARRSKITTMDIEKMCKYVQQGRSLENIADIMGVAPSTVQRHTQDIGKRTYRRISNNAIIEELKKGTEASEVANKLDTSLSRVEKLYMENRRDIEKKNIPLTERQIEIKKLCEEVARQKMKMQKGF
ncbi:MAG: helix-turn-helix transcriptional regulator, partial [Anaerovoracaceae bacterium]